MSEHSIVQAAGYRRPIRSERSAGFLFGGGVGVLYAVTTISGPPLAVALNNLSALLRDLHVVESHAAYLLMVAVIILVALSLLLKRPERVPTYAT